MAAWLQRLSTLRLTHDEQGTARGLMLHMSELERDAYLKDPPEVAEAAIRGLLREAVVTIPGVDFSEVFSSNLLQPALDAPPALADLPRFLAAPPVAQVPVSAGSSSAASPRIAQRFATASGRLARAVGYSLSAPLIFGAGKLWSLIAENTVVVTLLMELDAVLPASERIGLVAERDQGGPTSLMTVTSAGGRSLRPNGVLRDSAGLRMLAKWENGATKMHEAASDLYAKSAAWTPLYYGDIEYLPCFAAAGSQLQFFAIPRGGSRMQAPRPISPVLQLTFESDRAQAVLTTIKFYQLLRAQCTRYPNYVLMADRELRARHPNGFIRSLLFRTDEVAVRKRVAPWEEYVAWSGVEFAELQKLYDATKRSQGLVHALAGMPTLTDDRYSVDLIPLGRQPGYARPVTEDDARDMVHGLLHGLAAIHKAGFVHRDLRLDNTACSPNGRRWFLLDLETCAPAAQRPRDGFEPRGWPPGGLLVDGLYTCASDLFQLGRMVSEQCGSLVLSAEGKTFLNALQTTAAAQKLSAEQLLAHEWLQCQGETCRAAGAQPGER
ncbi:hypothetical protein TSOC_005423 [Tetrabaena socialis]|uniref:Protein kinase domain-containing protein n=1 Tax=Tetrabaena socialis TaxID=47790 RepID=A0A2J8A6E1_9CHLO|nr:hypothetical protein TSOC_005423 [Tetrabaena socialis]|eukprot:PNH08070.1 hypothetical protein TSOC_005423 [Tetrabaena socialis]